MYNGQGTFTFPDGRKYVGEWKDGLENGLGTYYWKNDDIYEGNFINGEMNGKGVYTYSDGEAVIGEWKDGELIKK